MAENRSPSSLVSRCGPDATQSSHQPTRTRGHLMERDRQGAFFVFLWFFFLLRAGHLINSCRAFLKGLPVTKPEVQGREMLLGLNANQEAKSSKLRRKTKHRS